MNSLSLSKFGDMSVGGSPNINIARINAGDSVIVSWDVRLGKNAATSDSSITVIAGGKITGAVPDIYWASNGAHYSGYSYYDWIGGDASKDL